MNNSVRVILALGSNLGERLALLEQACDALSQKYGDLRLSQVYESNPVNCPEGSPPYLNAALELTTRDSPQQLLKTCLQIERDLGRTRSGVYGEARSCDIDIISYGDEVINSPNLQIPHPRAMQRAFVLRPIADIDPFFTFANQQETVDQLLQQLSPESLDELHPFDL